MQEVGIYRVSGSTSDLNKLKKAFETSKYTCIYFRLLFKASNKVYLCDQTIIYIYGDILLYPCITFEESTFVPFIPKAKHKLDGRIYIFY